MGRIAHISGAKVTSNISGQLMFKKVVMVFAIMTFFMAEIIVAAEPEAGTVITNSAAVQYAGSGGSVQSAVDFTVRTLGGGDIGFGPTDIIVTCLVEPNCIGGLLVENVSGQVIATLAVVDEDQTEGHTLSVIDDIRFEIIGGKLKLAEGEFINYELEQRISITISAIDADGNTYQETLPIIVRDVNEAPFDLIIDDSNVNAETPGAPIGLLSVSDVDFIDQTVYTLVDDVRFVIADNLLSLAPEVVLEAGIIIKLTVVATDKGGLTTQSELTIEAEKNVPDPSFAVINFMASKDNGDEVEVAPAACIAEKVSTSLSKLITGANYQPGEISGSILLDSVSTYSNGDPLIISVADADQNLSVTELDHIKVVVTVVGGDSEVVTLTESGPDTGFFVGYIFSTSKLSDTNDCILSVASNNTVTTSYVDESDGNKVIKTSARITPLGIVFDDESGDAQNDIILTLINADTGAPAEVRGDGLVYAIFPATVLSGIATSDAAGGLYPSAKGEYRYPSLAEGNYRIEIFNSNAWVFSEKSDEELQSLGGDRSLVSNINGPYTLNEGSRGQVFKIKQGALPLIDIPVRRVVRAKEPDVITPSEIEFLQYSANPRIGRPFDVGETKCVTGETSQVSELKDVTVPVPGTVNLVPTTVFKSGQPIFVKVVDKDQNVDPTVREIITIYLVVEASNDKEWLVMEETGIDTGEFVGYIQSAGNESNIGSCVLGVVQTKSIQTVYTDAFDNTDTSNSRVLVDPFGLLFSTKDGGRINGVTVTIIDNATGLPAEVFGDGPQFAAYPSVLLSGGGTTDAAGLVYDFPPGGYRFPFVAPGFYHLELEGVSEDFVVPSIATIDVIRSLPNGPYSVTDGSYLETFEVPVGPALNIDIPLDEPQGDMFVSKEASKELAAIGDFIQYRLTVENKNDVSVAGLQVQDTLPKGFRYQKNSLTLNAVKAGNPTIAGDGRTMLIDLPPVDTNNIIITYVVEVTVGAATGPAINIARIIGDLVSDTNEASARVIVTDDLFRKKATLIGKVYLEKCEEERVNAPSEKNSDALEQDQKNGMPNIRLYLEDGSYVVTDEQGFWHIEGVEPGTHIIQLDKDSLEERYEVSPCNVNTRFAGNASSQFVDVKGGTLWRADFAIQEKPAPTSTVKLEQTLKVDNEGIWVSVKAVNDGPVQVENVKAIYNLPKGWVISADTERLDGHVTTHSKSIVGNVWNFGTIDGERELRFQIEPRVATKSKSSVPAKNRLDVLRPRFKTRSTHLTEQDLAELDALIATWKMHDWESIMVVGHTDNVPISPRNQHEFSDNSALSKARAMAVAKYLKGKVETEISVIGAGERYPISSNNTAGGREQNRRVEFLLKENPTQVAKTQVVSADILNGTSGVRLGFSSIGTAKGRTAVNKLPLNRLVGGFDVLSTVVTSEALGSWDVTAEEGSETITERDPNVQGLINVSDGERMSRAIRAVKFDLDSRLKPRLILDGVEVPSSRIGFSLDDDKTGKTLYSYIGVNFGEPGIHELVLEGLDGFNNPRYTETVQIVRVGDLYNISFVSAEGNIADGRSPVKVKLLLTDKEGEVITVAHKLVLESEELTRYDRNFSLSDFSKIKDNDFVEVDRFGILKFNPVTHSGVFQATLKFAKIEKKIEVFVEAEKRDWIMVGLAEGSIAYNKLSGNMESVKEAGIKDEVDTSGRVAFYAKGQVKGEYVLTLAYDTAKDTKNSLNQTIDPNSYYTLYGDQAATQYDAASQEKLFLKIERDQFYGMFGDFNTGLGITELSNYSRSLTGLKTEYKGKKFELNAFVSETDQAFIKDEIRGDGTSGLYRLSTSDVVINSEKITIETRDRYHTQDIVNAVSMTRHIDYNIDYDAGTIFFKSPVYSQDNEFNPIFIVIDFEASGDGDNKLNFGGRLAYKPKDGLEVGVTVVKEGVSRRESELVGVDLRYKISDATEVRAEVAATRSSIDENDSEGSAFLIEAKHRTSKIDAKAYVRQQQGAFGLGQQNSSESGTRKAGIDAIYAVNDEIEVKGEVYRETNLTTGTNQDVASTTMQMKGDKYTVTTGLRTAMSDAGDEDQVSNQALVGGSYRMLDGRLTLNANADAPIGGKGEAANFPKRLRVGLDYKLSDSITLKAEQEFSWGDQNTQKTRFGMNSSLWKGGELVTSIEQLDEENSQRLAAVAGLKQRFELNDQWSFDFGLDRSQTLKSVKKAPPPLQVTTVFSSPDNQDFTSLTFGSKFRQDAWDWSTRVEYRTADNEDKVNLVSDVIHNLEDGQQLLAKVNIQRIKSDLNKTFSTDIQFGYSYRPDDSRWTLFNRLDLRHSSTQGAGLDTQSQKIVNNLNANYLYDDRTQIALQYGMKYVIDNFDQDEYRGYTDLYGMEVRRDVSPRWDIGFQGSFYNSRNAGVSDYSYGVSFGYNMTKNVWMSLGYNFNGFGDEDFSSSEYKAEGVFLKYRMKFDQESMQGLKDMMR